jgi:hypothetical protein
VIVIGGIFYLLSDKVRRAHGISGQKRAASVVRGTSLDK